MRLDWEINGLIERYGSSVMLIRNRALAWGLTPLEPEQGATGCGQDLEEIATRAVLQWVKQEGAQFAPSALSRGDRQKLLYFGLASVPLSAETDEVLWLGQRFRVLSAHPVMSGSHIAYWRGVLVALDPSCMATG